MKKTYEAPAMIASGDIVRETKVGGNGTEIAGSQGIPQAPGSVGFNL